MSEKAIKIQEEWKLGVGDFTNWGEIISEQFGFDYFKVWMQEDLGRADSTTWLPRQDQLQKMLANDDELDYSMEELITGFHAFYIVSEGTMPHKVQIEEADKWADYINQFMSLEQLWLAFVMHEKYQKQWSEDKQEWLNA